MVGWELLLLPVASTIGWYLGQTKPPAKNHQYGQKLHSDYFIGLNFLLNEEPDKAVDVFIKMLEVDSETVEIHLALGNLFRRRGEIDRAIRIHQNLIARPSLSKTHKIQALLALGQDYLRAGVVDRAERLFQEVVTNGEQVDVSLRHLLDIYQQEKAWLRAVDTAKKLAQSNPEKMRMLIAQYYCELAVEAHLALEVDQAKHYLRLALRADGQCVRASLLQGEIAIESGDYQAAIRFYKNVQNQNTEYLSEVIGPLALCYARLNKEPEYFEYLQACLVYPRISTVLALTDYLQRWEGHEAAISFITEQLRLRPSLRGLQRLMALLLIDAKEAAKERLLVLQSLINKLLSGKPIYCCSNCGFNGKILHWLCPSCKNWSSVKPIHGLEGD